LNKPFYILFFLLCFCCETKSQTDYITNGSFEQIDSCYGQPAGIGFDVFEWSGCKGWSCPIASSSDLWCENPIINTLTPPNVIAGYQQPRTGNNMSAILINSGTVFNYREYIQNKLSLPLQNGKQYELTFYVSSTTTSCSVVELGVKFYNQKLYDSSKLWLTDVVPDAVNDYRTFIVDTLNWQLVKIPFIANGTEQYAVIGSFDDTTKIKNSSPCDTSFWGNLHLAYNYFFIDDVSIKELPFADVEFPNVITPNNDNVNDAIDFSKYHFTEMQFYVYNRWGNLVYETSDVKTIWNGNNKNDEPLNDGSYFYILNATTIENQEKNYKGLLQLIR
jgi:gliding motility-associated-like protein